MVLGASKASKGDIDGLILLSIGMMLLGISM